MIEVRFHKDVLSYFDELVDILIDESYFSFLESAIQYTEDLIDYVNHNVNIKNSKIAPIYFSVYGDNLHYITYHRSRRTTWYIFFQYVGEYYLVRHITNNHVAGQYFSTPN
jgi:hypothetical protein